MKSESEGTDAPVGAGRLGGQGDQGQPPQYRHPEKGMVVTVAGHPGKDVPVGTLKAILRSAELEEQEES